MLEKVVLTQLKTHLENNNLLENYQYAYRKCSTETALLHVLDNLLVGADEKMYHFSLCLISVRHLIQLTIKFFFKD